MSFSRGLNFLKPAPALVIRRSGGIVQNFSWGERYDYCRDRWGMARNYANKLIAAVGVADNLGTTVPITERQARPLARLEPEKQAAAWQEAVETAPEGKITAMHVENIVRKREMGGDEQTTRASEAMQYVTIAISQMDRIRADDPRRGEAIDKMQRWINKNKKGGR